MENNGVLGTIITAVVAFVILSVVLVPVVDSESSYYVERDENNENPLSDIRFTYTEQPVSKTYEIYWNNNSSPGNFRISGDYTYSGSLGTNQILMGTDNWNITVYEGTIRESIDGKSSILITRGSGTFTRTITNGIVEGTSEPYQYLYYPDEFGIYANYDSYEYNTADAYSVGSFAGLSVITKGGEIQNETAIPMVADTIVEDDEYTGMDFYPAPEPELQSEEIEPQDEEIVESLTTLGNVVEYSDGERVGKVEGGTAKANTNPSNSTLVGDLWYSLGNVNTSNYVLNGGAMVRGVRDANLSTIVIPSTVTLNGNTYDVVGVANNSFQGMSSLLSVTIPDSLRYFGRLNELGGSSVTDMSSGAVCQSCTSLSSFIFSPSSNLEVLGGSAFYNAKLLNLTSLPTTLKFIGNSCFNGCELIDLDIPSSVETVGGYAFSGCKALTQITWPSSITTIGDRTFAGCTSLTSISLPNTITSIGQYAFMNCPLLQLSTLPSSLTTIKSYAFQSCTSITFSSFPANVSSIGQYAFDGCTNVTFGALPTALTTISAYTFRDCINITISSIPNLVTNIENSAFRGCTSITNLNISSSVIAIGEYAFYGCTNLVIIELPVNLTSLGQGAFFNCANIIITKIPDGITALPGGVFRGCTSIVTMDLNNVSTIGYSSNGGSFLGCTGLISVIGSNVVELGQYTAQYERVDYSSAFSGCTSLVTVDMPNLTAIGISAFYNCSSLRTLNFPNVEYVVGSGCFVNCSSLTTLFMPSLETIYGSYGVFDIFCSGCTSLTTVTIPKVTALPNSAFNGCTNLSELIIGTLTQVGQYAFEKTPNLTIAIDCSDCTVIDNFAFKNSGIIGISLGENLTTIGTQAFYRCANLVITKENPIYATTINGEAFYECTSIESLELPNIITLNPNRQFQRCTALVEISAPNLVTISDASSGYSAFAGSLVIADMPKLETIGNYAFAGTKIKDTTSIMKSAITVGNYAFSSVALTTLRIGKNVETVGTQIAPPRANMCVIVEGSPIIANKWFEPNMAWVGPSVVLLGNPIFQGNWFYTTPPNGTHIDVLNFGSTDIYAGAYGLPQSTVIKTEFEDVAMLQVAEHVGLYKEYKTETVYVLLMILPSMLALGIAVAILFPHIRNRL